MKKSYTKGKWEIDLINFTPNNKESKANWICINDNKKRTIAEVKGIHCGINNDACLANAKLISAAPELLKACIKALEYHQGGHSEMGFMLKQAIKKATE